MKTAGTSAAAGADTYIRILAREGVTSAGLNGLEQSVVKQLGQSYDIESQNRIEDKITNEKIIDGYKLVMGSACCLLAMIGIANVFSYTSGFMRQRKREFAQYMSVGMTPAGMCRMFCAEALVIAGRPVLITLPLTALFVEFTARASYLNPKEVWSQIPIVTIAWFSLSIVGFVALAYCIGGKKVLEYSLADALRDDTMT